MVEENNFTFTDMTRILLKNIRGILAATIIVMLLTAVGSLLMQKKYKASATLLINESKMGIDGVISNYFNPRFYYTFEGLVKNKELVRRAIKKFNLDKKPYELSVEAVLENVHVALVRNTRLINLTVDFPDPILAAEIANFIAQEAVALNMVINNTDAVRAREFMSAQVNAVAESMKANEINLREYKQQAKIKELETDVETLLYNKADLSLRRSDALIKKAELEAAGKTAGTVSSSGGAATSIQELDALIASLDKMISEVEKTLDEKQKLLAERELRIEALLALFDADQTSYAKINTRMGENSTRVSEKFQEIRIIDSAIPPHYPEWPRKKLMVIIAGVLAFLFSCAFALMKEQMRTQSLS
ncbi:MAG: cryptic autophosphorylating protein tyrosine kinase Etk [candidate division BRC1 bacterium ADurb.Bin183]|nr:MAG: cryptic autophosphorylating protein tyrosine kinase Etk [candidate division BRC1 bacterium ADurb.Bin183]